MNAALDIEGLSFSYDAAAESPALQVHRLVLARGEQVLLTGGSGSGKSTLLHLIAGLLDADRGSVRVDGTDIRSLRGHHRDEFRGRSIGMVFQTFNLLPGFSAVENVMLALMFSAVPRGEHEPRSRALLASLGLTDVDRDVARMSVGQQQRVAVARAISCGPALVLADEPTASLDPANADAAIGLLQGACRSAGAALLCVSHDPAMASRFSRVESLSMLAAIGGGN